MRFIASGSIVVLLMLSVSHRTGLSSEPATQLADVDGDFALMGEYLGWVDSRAGSSDGARQRMGLQVVALGDGKFSAMGYRGGLPGNGWDRTERDRWQGEIEGGRLLLRDGDRTVQVQAGQAVLVDPEGQVVGTLPKVLRRSCTAGAAPPAWSIVLFDGNDTRAFKSPQVRDGLLQAGTELLPRYRDFTLHVEFCVPYMPRARGQGRGNSGVYLQSRYEIQILDSFGLAGESNECGGLYRYVAPDQNMAFPPLSWQTYDITFWSPRFDIAGQKVQDARLTVLHNGVVVHDQIRVERKTGAGRPETPELLPIKLQDHGNPVQFRNIWLVEHSAALCNSTGSAFSSAHDSPN